MDAAKPPQRSGLRAPRRMMLTSAVVLLSSLALYRGLLLGLPFFTSSVHDHPFCNIGCAVASDLELALTLLAGLLGWAAWTAAHSVRWSAWTAALGAWLVAALLAAHLRYVEHFGMNLRPFHLFSLTTPEVFRVGALTVLQSWRSDLILGVATLSLLMRSARLSALEAYWLGQSRRRQAQMLAALMCGAFVCHGLVMKLRGQPGMHAELRYNAFTALYYGSREYARVRALPLPSPTELARVRSLLGGERAYAMGETGRAFPLWQTRLPSGPALNPELQSLRAELRAVVSQGEREAGPWNVVVVLTETLRAEELHAMGNNSAAFAQLTPNLDRLAADGVRFSEVIGGGIRTAFGQVLSQCSLYGAENVTLVVSAPVSNAVCLTDVFAQKGYETHFFYGADNRFENQEIFYRFHLTAQIHGEDEFAKTAARGGWGVADGELFRHAVQTLALSRRPVYATILTLTNHHPYMVPQDVPPGVIDARLGVREQILQYVDWSTGRFYDELRLRLPHTIFVLVADHGRFGDANLSDQVPTYEVLRQAARIPLLLIVPGAPVSLRGREVSILASNADIAPTLLSLLGFTEQPQSFMGEDIFSRRGPIYIDWLNRLLAIERAPSGGTQVRLVEPELADLVGALSRYNVIAPPNALSEPARRNPTVP